MKLVFLLLLLSPLLVTSRPAAESQDAVLDTDGNPLQRGRQYYVRPKNQGNGGGLKMSRLQGSCPQNVVQKFSEEKNGQPIMIFPEEHSDDQIVRVSDRLYILFPRPTPCPQSTQWQVNGEYVTTGGTVSSNDPHNSRFAIFKSRAGDGYEIRSCPKRRPAQRCSTLGIEEANGQRLLSLRREKAFEFVFQKVTEESTQAAQAEEAILDTDGNPLQQGRQYHVLPRDAANGGGLRMSRIDGSCPPNVVQQYFQLQNGQPVMIFPEERTKDGVIRQSNRIYILFPRPSPCPQSTQWQVSAEYVTTGGTVSSNDPHNSRFAIFRSRAGNGYEIRSCPKQRTASRCSTLAVDEANGQRLLSVRPQNQAFEVVFQRVREESTNILPATMRRQA
ncbi:Kunitz family serine protease inhibitor [Streptococcus anginosus]|uniref:Kunitz family serine protease inhibitor n=1 Tax=Streptococcus anginosus TaxID=1328 RepID=UPI00301022E0